MIINVYDPTEVGVFRRGTDGLRVGITSGCFDLFHHLHLVYFERCRRLCDLLVVGVDSDDLVRSAKGHGRPVIPEHQRVAMVASQKSVAAAFVMGDVAAFASASAGLGASVVFKNQAFSGSDVAGAPPAELVIVADVNQYGSTSAIIEAIVAEAAAKASQADQRPRRRGEGGPQNDEKRT